MNLSRRIGNRSVAAKAWVLPAALIVGMLGNPSAAALEMPKEALQEARRIAVQHNGRIKPLDTYAIEVVRELSEAERIDGMSAVEVLLAMIAHPEEWKNKEILAVPFLPLREELDIGPKQKHVSYNSLMETRKLMLLLPPIVEKQRRDDKLTMLENEFMGLYNRFAVFTSLLENRIAIVPPARAGETVWQTIANPGRHTEENQQAIRSSWSGFVAALASGEDGAMIASTRELSTVLRSLNPPAYPADWRIDLELLYNQYKPFHIVRLIYAIAALFFLIGMLRKTGWSFKLGMAVLSAGFLLHLAGFIIRIILGERAPVSNFYETMLWIPFVAVFMALIFEKIYKANYFGFSAGILGIIVLFLADYLPVDPAISPVVAVLRSDFWLTVHVLTIVASYGALALAVVLAHAYCVVYMARPTGNADQLKQINLMIYRNLQVGVVLLAAGTILGGVWANASWGRFWGWDPKETWALITLLWYIAILHGRFAGWIKGVGLPLSTIAGFFLLLMTYYGVSFYLVGLHSYAGADAKPLPPLLIGYLIAEVIFMAVAGWAAYRRRAAA